MEDDDKISGTDSIEIKVDFEDVPRNMNPVWKHSVDKKGSLIHPVTKVRFLSGKGIYALSTNFFIVMLA